MDIAAFIIEGLEGPTIPLGSHLDDWLNDDFVLTEAIIMGYPPVPFSNGPVLVSARGEVNAVIDKYTGGHPQFIVSSLARSGFSGGPAISQYDFALGVITESLYQQDQPFELGFLSILSVEAIYVCLAHHHIVPKEINDTWNGFWTDSHYNGTIEFSDEPF